MQKLSDEAKKNKNDYIRQYNSQNTKTLSARFKLDEYEYIDKKIKEYGMNKAEFVRWAVEKLENE